MSQQRVCQFQFCLEQPRYTCLTCHKAGCGEHVSRRLIGGVAYMDLCDACAAGWEHRFNAPLPVAEPAPSRRRRADGAPACLRRRLRRARTASRGSRVRATPA